MEIKQYTSHTGFIEKITGRWYSELSCSEKAFKNFRYATEGEAKRFVSTTTPPAGKNTEQEGMSRTEEQALLTFMNRKSDADDPDLGEAVLRLINKSLNQ